ARARGGRRRRAREDRLHARAARAGGRRQARSGDGRRPALGQDRRSSDGPRAARVPGARRGAPPHVGAPHRGEAHRGRRGAPLGPPLLPPTSTEVDMSSRTASLALLAGLMCAAPAAALAAPAPPPAHAERTGAASPEHAAPAPAPAAREDAARYADREARSGR